MSEEAIREKAHKRNDAGRDKNFPSRDKLYKAKKESILLGDASFRDNVANYIDSIPLNPALLKHCPGCEGVLCGECGECHELDRKSLRTGIACPIARHMQQNDACVAWVYAFIFLRECSREIEDYG